MGLTSAPEPPNLPRVRWWILPLLALLAGDVSGQELEVSPFHGDEPSIGVGKATFRMRCSSCHGIHAAGGRGPALNRGEFAAGDTDLDIYRVISRGVPGSEMPAYGPRSTEENIWRIVAFLRTFEAVPGETVDGDPRRGEVLFWDKVGCGGCHKVGRRGGTFGPALTRIGRSRSVQYLRDSLLDPGRDLPPGYFVVRVVTRDGRTVAGIGLAIDDFSAQFRDAAGQLHSFMREDVVSVEREFASLMPSGYGESLSPEQQGDLLAYMQSLRGEESQ